MNRHEPSTYEGTHGCTDLTFLCSRFGRRTLPDGTLLAHLSEVNEIPYRYAHTSEIAKVLTIWLRRCKVTVHTIFSAILYIALGIFAMSAISTSVYQAQFHLVHHDDELLQHGDVLI